MILRMRLVAACALASMLGCATTAAVIKRHDEVSLPILIGTAVADLVVLGVIAKEAGGLSVGGAIGTSVAATAVDVFVACLIAPCSVLHPR